MPLFHAITFRYVLLWYNHEDDVPTSNFAQATTGSSSPTHLSSFAPAPSTLTLTLVVTLTLTAGCVWRTFPGHALTKYTATMQIKSSDKVFLRAIERPSGGGVAAPTTCPPARAAATTTSSAAGDGAPCFPSSATVVLASGVKRSLDALQVGDEIVVATAQMSYAIVTNLVWHRPAGACVGIVSGTKKGVGQAVHHNACAT